MTKILSISIHADDSEYAMGGTTKLLTDKGCEVTYVSITPEMHSDVAKTERYSLEAASFLGAKKIILDYKGDPDIYRTNDYTVRQLSKVILDTKPDILFMTYPSDNHVEHAECAKSTKEALYLARAACPNEIYSMEMGPFQSMCFMLPQLYINIDPVIADVEKANLHFSHIGAAGLWNEKEKAASFRGYEAETCSYNAGIFKHIRYAEAFRIEKYPFGSNDFYLRALLADQFLWSSLKMYHPHAHPMFHS